MDSVKDLYLKCIGKICFASGLCVYLPPIDIFDTPVDKHTSCGLFESGPLSDNNEIEDSHSYANKHHYCAKELDFVGAIYRICSLQSSTEIGQESIVSQNLFVMPTRVSIMQLDNDEIKTFIIYDNVYIANNVDITEDFKERGNSKWHMKLERFLAKSMSLRYIDIILMYESLIESILVTITDNNILMKFIQYMKNRIGIFLNKFFLKHLYVTAVRVTGCPEKEFVHYIKLIPSVRWTEFIEPDISLNLEIKLIKAVSFYIHFLYSFSLSVKNC